MKNVGDSSDIVSTGRRETDVIPISCNKKRKRKKKRKEKT
jgi:hypothetical protein